MCEYVFPLYRFAVKKSNQVIASFPDGGPFDSVDSDTFQRVWSNSCFQLKLSENFFTNGMVLVKNEVFNSDFDIDNLMKTIPKTVGFCKGTYKLVPLTKKFNLIFAMYGPNWA